MACGSHAHPVARRRVLPRVYTLYIHAWKAPVIFHAARSSLERAYTTSTAAPPPQLRRVSRSLGSWRRPPVRRGPRGGCCCVYSCVHCATPPLDASGRASRTRLYVRGFDARCKCAEKRPPVSCWREGDDAAGEMASRIRGASGNTALDHASRQVILNWTRCTGNTCSSPHCPRKCRFAQTCRPTRQPVIRFRLLCGYIVYASGTPRPRRR